MDKKKNSILVLHRGCCIVSKREGYYDYMLRRTKEENMKSMQKFDGVYKEPDFTNNIGEGISTSGDTFRREIKILNEQYYNALIRIKELNEEVTELKNKVKTLENANLHNN